MAGSLATLSEMRITEPQVSFTDLAFINQGIELDPVTNGA